MSTDDTQALAERALAGMYGFGESDQPMAEATTGWHHGARGGQSADTLALARMRAADEDDAEVALDRADTSQNGDELARLSGYARSDAELDRLFQGMAEAREMAGIEDDDPTDPASPRGLTVDEALRLSSDLTVEADHSVSRRVRALDIIARSALPQGDRITLARLIAEWDAALADLQETYA